MSEDQDEADEHEEERREDEEEGDEHGVGERGGAVPDALVVLGVKEMAAPAEEVGNLEEESSDPGPKAHTHRRLGCENLKVYHCTG